MNLNISKVIIKIIIKYIAKLFNKNLYLRDRFENTYLSLEAKLNRKTKIKNINILNLIEQFENKIINLQNNVPK